MAQSTGGTHAIVEVKAISKSFGKVKVLSDVSFSVDGGDIVCLLGPSGCGKTTTLRSIAGLESPDSGSIVIDRRVVSSSAEGINVPPEKRNIGLVFQSYALWPNMTVLQHAEYGLKRRKLPKPEVQEKANAMLALLGLSGLEGRYPWQLSGGQQQRVAMARSLAYGPKVLLLDEPLSNVDQKERERVLGELRKLFSRLQITVIYVTHDQEEAFALANKVLLLNQGRIVQVGSPEELYENPISIFAANFVGKPNVLKGRLEGIDGQPKFRPDNSTLALSCRSSGLKEGRVLAFVKRNEIGLRETSKSSATDNVFAGKIVRRTFKGDTVEYVVQTEFAELVVSSHKYCDFSNAGGAVEVSVSIPSGAIHVVPE